MSIFNFSFRWVTRKAVLEHKIENPLPVSLEVARDSSLIYFYDIVISWNKMAAKSDNFARCFDVSDPQKHPKGHTIYKVTYKVSSWQNLPTEVKIIGVLFVVIELQNQYVGS
jgi:hypothetical protein